MQLVFNLQKYGLLILEGPIYLNAKIHYFATRN